MSTAINTPKGTGFRADPTVHGHGWAYAGVVAGLAGVLSIGASLSVSAVYDTENLGNAEKIVAALKETTNNLLVFHVATMVAAVTLLVFAAGVRRRLAGQTRPSSILPDVAAAGLTLTAVACLMGSALDTEFIFGVNAPKGELVPEVGALYGHWVGTVPWLWVGAGLAGVAIAAASLKQGAAPRWIGWVGAILGGLTLVAGVSPLQYMAGFTGPIVVLLIALGFAFGDRDELS